jgi:hypothetical protein
MELKAKEKEAQIKVLGYCRINRQRTRFIII